MKQVNKLILAVTCYALCAVLLAGSALYVITDPRTSGVTPTPDSGLPGDTRPTPDTQPAPEKDYFDAERQNGMLISGDAFFTPANQYRALRLEHEINHLPGSTAEEKAAALQAQGFGGAVTNAVWDAQYLQSKLALAQLNEYVQALDALGLRVWIYDEKGYPSGSAGDLTVQGHPEYAAVRLVQITHTGNGTKKQTVNAPDGFVKVDCAFIKTADTELAPLDVTESGGKLSFTGVQGDWVAYIYCAANYVYHFEWNSSYPNILNRDAVARFIEVTFDTYENAIDRFDSVVEAIFDDEAQLLAGHHIMPAGLKNPVIPYDYDIFETFEAKFGYDPRPCLPQIFSGSGEEARLVRAQYYSHVGDLVSENFFGQIQEWCAAHGTELSGHLLLEEQMYYHIPVYGNYIQCSLRMGYPGFDVLDVRPANYLRNMSTGGKYASSPAWLSGKERVLIEICPVADPDEFATKHLDYALGCMTFAYFDGGNQIASYYSQANNDPATGNAFNTYVGRLGSMTVGAQNLTQVAIYYGIDTVGGEYRAPDSQNLYDSVSAARRNDALVGNIAEKLRENGLDYVFLDDESMQGGSVKDGAMCVGNFAFTTVIVPDVEIMEIESMRMLDAMIKGGVNVVFVDAMPGMSLRGEHQAEMTALAEAHGDRLYKKNDPALIEAVANHTRVALTVESKATVYVSPYEKDGVKFFFLANASKKDASVTFACENAVAYRIYDPVSGEISTVENAAEIASYRALFVQPLTEMP